MTTLPKGFNTDKRGNVATTFALTFIPAMLVTGAAVDYSRSVTQWSNLQQATDATALTIAHTYLNSLSTTVGLNTFAQNYISGIMNGATVTGVTIGQNNTQVCVSSSYTVKSMIMQIVNIKTVPVSTIACSQIGGTYEVALALDNSGSMAESAGGQSKITALQNAATQLVNILIPTGTTTPATAISIVPFTSMVNVGTSRLAPFLDTTGGSSIHWQNFHRPSGVGLFHPTSKFDLYDTMTNTSWGGCVEERPAPYITSDTAASASSPDTMFVPYFSPDEPGAVDSGSGYACYPTSGSCGRSVPPYIFYNSYIADNGTSTSAGVCSSSTAYANADSVTTYSGDGQTNIYPGAGLSMVCKYKGTRASAQTSAYSIQVGPNFMCSSQQMTPLTTDSSVLTSAINSMQANGSTNLATGFMWAWRSISPVVNPFPTVSVLPVGPQNPKSYTYGPPPNTKVIILMTDGFNSWTGNSNNTFGSLYEAFGYYANGRITSYSNAPSGVSGASNCSGTATTSSTFRCQMDNITLEACSKAKAAGVVVYTIGFSIPSDPIDTQGLNLLQKCASSNANFFQASDSTSIVTAFQQIAAAIQNLRLTQ